MSQPKYLACTVQASGDISKEIMSQIGQAATAFICLSKIQSLKVFTFKNKLNIQFMLFSTWQMDVKAGNLSEVQAVVQETWWNTLKKKEKEKRRYYSGQSVLWSICEKGAPQGTLPRAGPPLGAAGGRDHGQLRRRLQPAAGRCREARSRVLLKRLWY